MIDCLFFMTQLIIVWSDNPRSTYILLVDNWHACNVECNLRWCQALNSKEQQASINSGTLEWKWNRLLTRPLFPVGEKCGLRTRLPFQILGFCSFVVWHYKWSQWEHLGIFNWPILHLNHWNCISRHFCCTITLIWEISEWSFRRYLSDISLILIHIPFFLIHI